MTALSPLPGFPYLTREEFTAACRALVAKVDTFLQRDGDLTTRLGWTGVRLEAKDDEIVLIIHKQLDDEEITSPRHLKHMDDTLKSNEVEKYDDDTAEIIELHHDDDDVDDVDVDDDDDHNDPVQRKPKKKKTLKKGSAVVHCGVDSDNVRGTQEELIRQRCRSTKLQVEYNIMLSPTYQVPILYFFVHNVINNSNISAKGPEGLLDIVYNRLVPTQYRSELKDVGIMGGLSIGHHPLSDLPVYFVHPCNTPDALRDVAGNKEVVVTTETYLLLWLGLVGNCVGLHVPSELLIGRRNP
ncbi:hypothetical protein GX50_02785 [[Emmonsia] crescens]|uniref:Ubiquitin-like-conjugating enzyme ATG10 n=1 Tax=[Emmonsia] crescens TaxID=73230 RepID=A0A2B7ZNR0_9EURO|nr:hypothetical protein GX50_02785 [Emmonsia crescens]